MITVFLLTTPPIFFMDGGIQNGATKCAPAVLTNRKNYLSEKAYASLAQW
jgi:hypothetical protein